MTTQTAKCLLSNHEALCLYPPTYEKPGSMTRACNPSVGEAEAEGLLEPAGQLEQPGLQAFHLRTDLVSKNMVGSK